MRPSPVGVICAAVGGLLVGAASFAAVRAAADNEPGFVRLPERAASESLARRPTPSRPPAPTPPPATRAAARVLETLASVEARLRTTRYQHRTVVRERQGLYAWDCSGMAAWVLDRAAPRARVAVGKDRPVARDFYRAIARAPANRARRGWQRLTRIEEARAGDVLAWVRPPWFQSTSTGHVAFLLDAPERAQGLDNAFTVRVADATSLPHQHDSRTDDGEGGYGVGALLLMVNDAGAPTAYGWFGDDTQWVVPTDIVLGRVLR